MIGPSPLQEALEAASDTTLRGLADRVGLSRRALPRLRAADTAPWVRREIAAALGRPERELFPPIERMTRYAGRFDRP